MEFFFELVPHGATTPPGTSATAQAGYECTACGGDAHWNPAKGTIVCASCGGRLVTPDEVGLVPTGISAASPLAQALLGAMVGDTVELDLPRGTEELTILSIEWPT